MTTASHAPSPFLADGLLSKDGDPAEDTQPLAPLLTASPPTRAVSPQALGPFAGRYRLEGLLGSGGLGSVWAAHDPLLGRPVAIKALPAGLDAGERDALSQRFLEEARIAARLEHPCIVTVYDAGLHAEHGAYIVMTLLRGKDLRKALGTGWRPSPREACRIVQRVAEALAYAHAQGVVHRDIKPANIVMVARTRPVVLDFGLAHTGALHDSDAPALGSPYYAAPEQFEGRPADRRTDIYALGVLLYELLTGTRPFAGTTLGEIRAAVASGRVQPPSARHSTLPRGLDTIVLRAMATDPNSRHASAGEFARELRAWRLGQRSHSAGQHTRVLRHRWWPHMRTLGLHLGQRIGARIGLRRGRGRQAGTAPADRPAADQ